jgi:hypothetical protein
MSEEQQRRPESDDERDEETFERLSREKPSQPPSDELPSDQDIGKD